MKFGIFDHMERREDCDLTQLYEDRLTLMSQADDAGIYAYHIAEHHHSMLCMTPNQSVFLAAAAQRTKRIKIGTLVYVLPLYHPIRLIEEICMVDRLSNGRVQVGVGRGSGGGYEAGMWGVDHDQVELFRETLEILLKGFQSEFLNHQGKHYQFSDLWMGLRSVQQPHPDLWYAGNPDQAGEFGMNFIGNGDIAATKNVVARYLAAYDRGMKNPGPWTGTRREMLYGTNRRIFVADTDGEAEARAAEAYEVYRTHYLKPAPPGFASDDPRRRDTRLMPNHPSNATPQEAMADHSLLVGSPSTIRDFVHRYNRESDANYFVGAFQWGDLTHTESSTSLSLFATEVMPAIDALGAVE